MRVPTDEVQGAIRGDTREIDKHVVIDDGAQPYGSAPSVALPFNSPDIGTRRGLAPIEIVLHQRLSIRRNGPIGIEQQIASIRRDERILVEPVPGETCDPRR